MTNTENLVETLIDINNVKYQYFETGSGDVTIFIFHGLAGGNEQEVEHFSVLRNKYHCYFIDLPGHGGVSIDGIKSIDDYINYVSNFIEYIKPAKLILAGFSFGGIVAALTSEKYFKQKKIIPVILWASPIKVKKTFITKRAAFCLNLAQPLPLKYYRKFIESQNFLKLTKLIGINFTSTDIEAFKKFNNKSVKTLRSFFNKEHQIPEQIPALYVFGTEDIFVDKNLYESLKITNNKIQRKVLVKNGGHFGTKEGEKEALTYIDSFINNLISTTWTN